MMHVLSVRSGHASGAGKKKKPSKASGGCLFPLEILLQNSRSAHRALWLKAPWHLQARLPDSDNLGITPDA
jgi:hypothetical protein